MRTFDSTQARALARAMDLVEAALVDNGLSPAEGGQSLLVEITDGRGGGTFVQLVFERNGGDWTLVAGQPAQ